MEQTTLPPIPTPLADRLMREAEAMNLSIGAYLLFLEQCRSKRLDAKAQDALRHVLRTQRESLEKLAQ